MGVPWGSLYGPLGGGPFTVQTLKGVPLGGPFTVQTLKGVLMGVSHEEGFP